MTLVGDVLGLGWGAYAVALVAVFLGTLLQRLAGQGFGMLAAPIIAMGAPELLPATLLLLGLVVGLGATVVDVRALVPRDLPPGFAGRALGAVIAAMVAARFADPDTLAVLIAGIVYLGIALSLIGARVPIVPGTLFLAGTLAGLMGTLTAIGAPPMALLYQHVERRRSAATQNVFFFWGMTVSLLALAWQGLVGLPSVAFAGLLLPGVGLGLLAAYPLSRRFERTAIRPYALGLAGLAATTLLIRLL